MRKGLSGRMVRFLLFTAKWNAKSTELRNTIQTFMPQLRPDVKVEEVALEDNPGDHQKYAIRVYPTLVKLVDETEVARKTDLDLITLVEFCQGEENGEGKFCGLEQAVS